MSSALANEEARLRLFFDPDDHPENTLKAFQEFIQRFELHYDAMYPDPPKVSLEAATEQWKIMEATSENPSPKPNLEQFDNLCEHTKACNKVSKFLGIYSSRRLYIDWCMATPEEKTRKNAVERFRGNVSLLQTNRKHHLDTFSFSIKYSKRW